MSNILLPATIISESVKQSLAFLTIEEAQVTVHVSYQVTNPGEGIRIWPTTYLVPQEGGNKSSLLTQDNISLAPYWTILRKKGDYRFTLIFSALPKDCKLFHLWEDIDQPGGFLIRNIRRNNSDVYQVRLELSGVG
jgi:hypothetical protein